MSRFSELIKEFSKEVSYPSEEVETVIKHFFIFLEDHIENNPLEEFCIKNFGKFKVYKKRVEKLLERVNNKEVNTKRELEQKQIYEDYLSKMD